MTILPQDLLGAAVHEAPISDACPLQSDPLRRRPNHARLLLLSDGSWLLSLGLHLPPPPRQAAQGHTFHPLHCEKIQETEAVSARFNKVTGLELPKALDVPLSRLQPPRSSVSSTPVSLPTIPEEDP